MWHFECFGIGFMCICIGIRVIFLPNINITNNKRPGV